MKPYQEFGTDIGPACVRCGGTIYALKAWLGEADDSWHVAARCVSHNGEVARWEQTSAPDLESMKRRLRDAAFWTITREVQS
jgi:hypothetical protein